MHAFRESRHRSLIKSISYRAFAVVTTTLIVFAFTGRLILSLSIGAVEGITKIILYYAHERMWTSISLGKQKHPLSSLPVDRPLKEKDMEQVKKKLTELGYISENLNADS